jgi:selenocysteine-specific elongation factor
MAGHIDHGKTALIKALSGIQTDQLKEEKERGITIDLGFAYWKDDITIIDVPGHEKFVRNMIAGVNTIDFFILVIAADDGIMPQTREHLDILKFLKVKNGIVALNKIDAVEDDWLELVRTDIRQYLNRNEYENIEIFPVSAQTGKGIDHLTKSVEQKISAIDNDTQTGRAFHYNVDRAFSAKGFGSVVTGTVLHHSISVNDALLVFPGMKETKVRSIQLHQKQALKAFPGQRAALNLSNLTVEELPRGAVLKTPNTFISVKTLLAQVNTTSSFPFKIKRRSKIRLLLGTAEYMAKINWLEDEKTLEQGGKYHLFIDLERTVIAEAGDAVLLRSISPVTTIAGGTILQINPPALKMIKHQWESYIECILSKDAGRNIEQFFAFRGYGSFSLQEMILHTGLSPSNIEKEVFKLQKNKKIIALKNDDDCQYIWKKQLEAASVILLKSIENTLEQNKSQKGFNFTEIENLIRQYEFSKNFLQTLIQLLINRQALIKTDGLYATPNNAGGILIEQFIHKIEQKYKESAFMPIEIEQLSDLFSLKLNQVKMITKELVRQKKLISIGGTYYLHREILDRFVAFLNNHFSTQQELGINDVKEFCASSRKYIIPLLEYCDLAGLTKREGQTRVKG